MGGSARIIFAGSPDFAVPVLQGLLASRHSVIAVLTQPDRPAGRGRKLHEGPVKVAARAAGLSIMQPASLAGAAEQAALAELQPDLLVVVAYGLLLPPAVLATPRVACVNVHASLLPRWRGASPIQAAILAGDSETGISIMQMDSGLDTGPVYTRKRLAIGERETAGELHDRLAVLGGELLAESLDSILDGELVAVPQPDQGVTYAGRIAKADGLIDWSQSAASIARRIRAYNPWPVAQSTLDGESLRCWMAVHSGAVPAGVARAGEVLAVDPAGIHVQTGSGVLTLTEVQAAGRKRMSAVQFARARPLVGAVLGA